MRWAAPHGWLVGKITEKFTQSTPRLFAKFNYRIQWHDGWQTHKLILDNYLHSGPHCSLQQLGAAGEGERDRVDLQLYCEQ